MLPVAESFIQHDPLLQHSTEFSGLGANSSYNSLAEFYDQFQAKIRFFLGNSVSPWGDMQTSK